MKKHSELLLESASIALVIPAYRAKSHILEVLESVPKYVSLIILVDDACPEKTGDFARAMFADSRLVVIQHSLNLGVGGAMKSGYREAFNRNSEIVVKIDADNQMDQKLIPYFVLPLLEKKCDFTKGNRFVSPRSIAEMPRVRIFGNLFLSFMSKFSTGYWDIFDPTNGYTAINSSVLSQVEMDKVDNGFFFECDMLFRLGIARAVVRDIPMNAKYGQEKSNLMISKILTTFLSRHLRNTAKRLGYSYFLRDFNVASISLFLGSILTFLSIAIGSYSWVHSYINQVQTPIGTQFLFLTFFVAGIYSLVNFLNFDMQMTPRVPISQND